MATQQPPQRSYRAPCPNCGAPVEFRSAASAFAVCAFCRSTIARDGAALRRIGTAAELFDDHSPLQLGVSGRFLNAAFTLVGRVQLAYDGGVWNEWHAHFDAGRSGWLSEDNGRYVFAFPAPPGDPPPLASLPVGAGVTIGGVPWTVASSVHARPGAVEGELPAAPQAAGHVVVELRNPRGEVASLEYPAAGGAPAVFVGRAVELGDLALSGLKEESAREFKAQATACPQCGAALAPTLEATKTIVCGQCHAVVDLSPGIGGDLAYYVQHNGGESGLQSQIELGASATLALGGAAQPWQVVGYVERRTVPGGDAEDVEFWREYLLYNRLRGFAFLVDANDGWSWTAPLAGAPQFDGGRAAQWQGTTYRELYRYTGRVTYVLGEFYWRLAQDETTFNVDYADASGRRRLNREQTDEVVWSGGETLEAAAIARAFGLPDAAPLLRDASPLRFDGSRLLVVVVIAVILFGAIAVLAAAMGDRCRDVRAAYGVQSAEYLACSRAVGSGASYRSSGGAFGGASGAGGHK
ncbi:MAG TPA: DUF4178 domain-containing protein [Burkholderiaceae bacterium]|nr:DUF4178 domain-containing protein [Burkholderiaceae bacterium]